MTERQLIAEYILQQIKMNDLVELALTNKKILKGYVIESDVFKKKLLQHELKEKIYGIPSHYKAAISIYPLKEKNEFEEELKQSTFLNFNFLPNQAPVEIYPEEIVSIKKIE